MEQCLERLDRLIRISLEHLEHVQGTVYETYAEEMLQNLIAERKRVILSLSLRN